PLTFALSRNVAAMERAWLAAAQRVAEVSAAGLDAAFVTEGDPLTYSTFVHLYRTLQHEHPRVPVQVVPGITSFAAASAAALHPLVDQDERLAVIPASYAPAALERVLHEFDTVVLLKVSAVFDQVLDLLERLNLVDHALYVRRVGRPEQEVRHDLRALRGQSLDYFSLVIVYPAEGVLNV
ncbi:MAG TPA: precorrin-2 C(20)-methyltransferase, partial [Chloroflexota bacterium]